MEEMVKEINFDMDGTLNKFYEVEGWLEDLQNSNPRPYKVAKPRVNIKSFKKEIRRLKKDGYKINIISWLSKNSDEIFDETVTDTKLGWVDEFFPHLFDKISIVKYGTPKSTCGQGILFDDEERNRKEWGKGAYDVDNIIEVLKSL